MPERTHAQTIALGLLGAVAGGIVGYFAFVWLIRQGLYAMVLPPALVGLGAGICAGQSSRLLAIVCAIAGLALGLFLEWKFVPFVADSGLAYFLAHLHQLKPVTWIMLLVGAAVSYSFAHRSRSSSP
jgi:hypothetical protein